MITKEKKMQNYNGSTHSKTGSGIPIPDEEIKRNFLFILIS